MGRKLPIYVTLMMMLALSLVPKPALAGSPVFNVDLEFYPYYPSLIKWDKSPAEFTPPSVCKNCHVKQYKEWTGSVHSFAFRDPVYQGELNKANKAVGHEITRQCEGCHSPAGMVTGEIKGPGNTGLSEMALAGVSCDICHSISGVTHWQTPSHEPENGSFILSPGIENKEGVQLVKRGPIKPHSGCGGGFHECAESGLHLRAELCASCHQVYHHDAHFPLEATYNEWKHGPYAQKNILCQDCHMVDIEGFKHSADQFAKPDRKEYRHYFNGANYLLTYLAAGAAKKAGDDEQAKILMKQYDMAVERLKSAGDLEISPEYQNGRLAEVKVRVKNVRAGHNLPTSLTNVRQMWLEITAKDESGKIIMSSGVVKADGTLPDNSRIFNSDGMGENFHFAVDPWVITSFSKHDTIKPKGYKDVFYGIAAPGGVKSLSIEVKLRYRQADQKVAEELLGAVPKDIELEKVYGLASVPPLPVVDMVVKQSVFATER
ncbi:MAG: cytochrome c family protein [Oryzomonas sp.]|uniref:cytochrome c family protein n=1 Tax=Oryzomonas sp. TaxID=2855186 RepID=UPI00284D2C4E|nr:cytochrome c family protein [Oryzomonas sp.]MDR3581443.1 cytochrome c family protein [Oryzomonas sp.]